MSWEIYFVIAGLWWVVIELLTIYFEYDRLNKHFIRRVVLGLAWPLCLVVICMALCALFMIFWWIFTKFDP